MTRTLDELIEIDSMSRGTLNTSAHVIEVESVIEQVTKTVDLNNIEVNVSVDPTAETIVVDGGRHIRR